MSINPITHKEILLKILKDIYKDPLIGQFLGFKGGTAAMMFYALPRVSVDLDFDLLDPKQEDLVFTQVKEIITQHGVIKDASKKRYTLFYLLSYNEKTHGAQNVKIDISRRLYLSKYQPLEHLGISMQVMVQADMAANKLLALHTRLEDATRDIFDVWYFLSSNWEVNKNLIVERVQKPYKTFLEECIIKLEAFDNRRLLTGLGELLDEKQKAWARIKLKSEALFQLRLALELEK